MISSIEKAIIGILFIWICLSVHQIIIYEENIYDCSNMVADQEQFFNSLGIDTQIGIRYRTEDKYAHVWLILPFGIPFECTILSVQPFNHKPDEVFNSVKELITIHPDTRDDFITSC
jgi:hypothetical protein